MGDCQLWSELFLRTFDTSTSTVRSTPKDDYKDRLIHRIETLREFIVRGTDDFHAATMRRLFSEMNMRRSAGNAALIAGLIEDSEIPISQILQDGRGFVMSTKSMFKATRSQTGSNKNQLDSRSEVYLIRMLLARITGYQAAKRDLPDFLQLAHLVVYNSSRFPLFTDPIAGDNTTSSDPTYRLEMNETDSKVVNGDSEHIFSVHWGVVEAIYSLIRLYIDRLPESIPTFCPPRDFIEPEVPLESCMFSAPITGHWKGLYGYLDFRDLERLSVDSSVSPDCFDGLQNICITLTDRLRDAPSVEEAKYAHGFSGLGVSCHGPFGIIGTFTSLPGMGGKRSKECGYGRVTFDRMFNDIHLMPWVMDGVYIPSIGIVGRWRDGTQEAGEGVEGPYVLWRDRVRDADRWSQDEGCITELDKFTLKRALSDIEYAVVERYTSVSDLKQ